MWQCCGSFLFCYGSGSWSSDPFREIMDPDPDPRIRPKIGKISTFVLLFFVYKKYISWNIICFFIYGVNLYVSKHEYNSFEKNVWYYNDFGWFLWKVSMILADFLLPGSGSVSLKRIRIRLTKMKQIQTDPDPQHCFVEPNTVHWCMIWSYDIMSQSIQNRLHAIFGRYTFSMQYLSCQRTCPLKWLNKMHIQYIHCTTAL